MCRRCDSSSVLLVWVKEVTSFCREFDVCSRDLSLLFSWLKHCIVLHVVVRSSGCRAERGSWKPLIQWRVSPDGWKTWILEQQDWWRLSCDDSVKHRNNSPFCDVCWVCFLRVYFVVFDYFVCFWASNALNICWNFVFNWMHFDSVCASDEFSGQLVSSVLDCPSFLVLRTEF